MNGSLMNMAALMGLAFVAYVCKFIYEHASHKKDVDASMGDSLIAGQHRK